MSEPERSEASDGERAMPADQRERAQRGVVVWFTGIPAAGKTTLADSVRALLERARLPVVMLDGDLVRACLVPPLGYSGPARDAFYQTLGNLAALMARQGLAVLVPATAYRRAYREAARAQAPAFIEVHVRASVHDAASRDPKGLYQDAGAGRLRGLPGADLEYEEPAAPEVVADGGLDRSAAERVAHQVAVYLQRDG